MFGLGFEHRETSYLFFETRFLQRTKLLQSSGATRSVPDASPTSSRDYLHDENQEIHIPYFYFYLYFQKYNPVSFLIFSYLFLSILVHSN